MDQQTLLKVFYDPSEDCFGYSYALKDTAADDLIRILIELNGLTDDVLHLLKDKLNEA